MLHYKRPLFLSMLSISSAKQAIVIIRKSIDTAQLDLKEFFWVLLLSNANRLIAIAEVGKGTTQSVVVNTKEIFQLALKTNASAIILCHNHPSGLLKASDKDIQQTKKLQKMAKILEITVLDHLIITSESFLSFAEEGIL